MRKDYLGVGKVVFRGTIKDEISSKRCDHIRDKR